MTVTILLSLMPSFFYALFRFSIGVALPEVAIEFSLDPVQAGLLLSVSLAATTATSGLAGYLSDKVGEKLVLTSGFLLFSAGLLAATISSRFDLFMILIAVSGLGTGLMLTPAYSIVGRILPKSRGLVIGAVSSPYNIGGLVGPVLTSALLAAAGWRIPFALIGASGMAIAILLFSALSIPTIPVPAQNPLQPRSSKLGLLREPNIVVIGASMFLADLAFLAFVSWTPTFMRGDLSMPIELVGFWFGVAIAVGAVGVVLMGYLLDRIGGKRATMISGLTSAALTFLFFIQPTGSAAALTILVLAGFVSSTFWSLLSALAQVSVNEAQLGTATGIIQNIGFVGAVIGPSIVGSIVKGADISSALILTVSLPYLLYALLMLLYKERRSTTQIGA
jgi:MFS family permease